MSWSIKHLQGKDSRRIVGPMVDASSSSDVRLQTYHELATGPGLPLHGDKGQISGHQLPEKQVEEIDGVRDQR